MSTPLGYLLNLPNKQYSALCANYHPDDNRIVILTELPNEKNNLSILSCGARFVKGKYYDLITGAELPIKLEHTVWMECPYTEGPYYVLNTNSEKQEPNLIFQNSENADKCINKINTPTMWKPIYAVVNKYGAMVDRKGLVYFIDFK